ncbi:MAG TPA: choice-of-anchor P family protein, partial [Acidimicrobiales bacterium]
NVAPNTTLTIKNPLNPRQNLAEVVLYEEVKSADIVNGKFTTSISVNMIRVTLLRSFLTLAKGAEIIVSHANADATYPTGLACGTFASNVSGEAFTAYAKGTLFGNTLAETKVSQAIITPLGGSASNNVGVLLPPFATSGTATNSASGSTSPNPSSQAQSRVEGVSLLNGLITATVLDVKAESSANGTTAGTMFTTTFTNLRVNGITINLPVRPNTTIAIPQGGGIILVILNEQTVGGNGTKDTFGTVNGVHVKVLNASNVVTAEVIVASAHSDAHKA